MRLEFLPHGIALALQRLGMGDIEPGIIPSPLKADSLGIPMALPM
jgi:hypothetical protein